MNKRVIRHKNYSNLLMIAYLAFMENKIAYNESCCCKYENS